MRKAIVYCMVFLLSFALVLALNDSKETQNNGKGFLEIWDAINNLKAMILNIQLTPGPQGPIGPKGDKGDPGETGLQGEVGSQGLPGEDGLNCWDLNGNHACNSEEDKNADSYCNVLDCIGPQGEKGEKGEPGTQGLEGTCSCPITLEMYNGLLERIKALEGECVPAAEVCDGLDNDCDGQVDEGDVCAQEENCTADADCNDNNGCTIDTCSQGMCEHTSQVCDDQDICTVDTCTSTGPDEFTCAFTASGMCECINGQTQQCYTGPAGTADVGECSYGTQACNQGYWGSCVGEVTPTTDGASSCDNLDNDCDGIVDDAFGYGGSVNYIDWNGAQKAKGNGCGTGVCAGGVVVCATPSSLTCDSLGAISAEVCDGQDNDCDGITDEGGSSLCTNNDCISGICLSGMCHYTTKCTGTCPVIVPCPPWGGGCGPEYQDNKCIDGQQCWCTPN